MLRCFVQSMSDRVVDEQTKLKRKAQDELERKQRPPPTAHLSVHVPFECSVCNTTIVGRPSTLFWKQNPDGSAQTMYSCDKCEYEYQQAWALMANHWPWSALTGQYPAFGQYPAQYRATMSGTDRPSSGSGAGSSSMDCS